MEHFIFYRSDSDCVDFHIIVTYVYCLQCFDAVAWAAGRASGL